ncbi:MAG TPA: hypothetical protein VGM82_13570 [Gemmatimonadaceae bacterium]|jgi:hypothetical protein
MDREADIADSAAIALAAFIVSLTAVVGGVYVYVYVYVYEAWLQRSHDRAEAWPHVEIGTWITDSPVTLRLDNSGLGPALIHSVEVSVDGRAQRSVDECSWMRRRGARDRSRFDLVGPQ